MKPTTPAITIREKDLAKNVEALGGCLDLVRGRIKTVLDVRYGLGGWAKLIMERVKPISYVGTELDQVTYEAAWRHPKVNLINSPLPEKLWHKKWSLVLADFNNLTSLHRGELDWLLPRVTADWLIFTDVACGKLHLNYGSYGLRKPMLAEYWGRFAVEGYELVGYYRAHHFASSAVYQKAPTMRG